MTTYFIPYVQDRPAAIDIKGHKLVLVTTRRDDIAEDLTSVGGEAIREMRLNDNVMDQTTELSKLAASVNGGIVLTPPGVSVASMIRNLERELPWLH